MLLRKITVVKNDIGGSFESARLSRLGKKCEIIGPKLMFFFKCLLTVSWKCYVIKDLIKYIWYPTVLIGF